MKIQPLNILFEPAAFCPTRCPSCPQGVRTLKREAGVAGHLLTEPEMWIILNRLRMQGVQFNVVNLFNWDEPLLNPDLPELVRTARTFGPAALSTTGNFVKCDLQELVDSEPDRLVVATSGWTQAVYETTHPACSVVKFRSFCEELARLKAKNVHICYHRYNNNKHEEPLARDFARSLGFKFTTSWAYHAPVEALIKQESNDFQLVKTPEALEMVAHREADHTCDIQTSELVFDWRGDMRGCSAAADQTVIGNVFKDSIEVLLERKQQYSLCDSCYKCGAYKICCGRSRAIDAEASRRYATNLIESSRHFIERSKKWWWQKQALRPAK